MKKVILLIIFIFYIPLFANDLKITANYTISYGIFSELGVAKTTLLIKDGKYHIQVRANATGLAGFLTKNRVETYESFGTVIDNKFIPDKFLKIKKDDEKTRIKEYIFKDKKVLLTTTNKGFKKVISSDLKTQNKSFKEKNQNELEYYAKEDILSLFFNLKDMLINFEEEKDYKLKAVGANKSKGIINILVPKDKKLKELDTQNSIHLIAYINQQIFGSQRGELLVSLDKNGFCNKAVLKDVLLFGDIVGTMKNIKIKEG